MQRLQFKLAAMALALAASTLYAASLPNGRVYSANEGDNSISEIKLSDGAVKTIKVPIVPHNVQIAPDGKTLLAVGVPASSHGMHGMAAGGKPSGHTEEANGKLLVMDTKQLHKVQAILPAGNHPAHVVTDPLGKRAYVTSSEDNQVTVLDLKQKRILATIPTGAFPHGLRPSPDGRELYVANVADNSVSVIDTIRLKEAARIPVGHAPVQVGFSPDGARVYVSLRDDNQLAVIDTATRQVINRIEVGRNPIQVYATANGRKVYVANQGTDEKPEDKVSVIDAGTLRVTDTVITGAGAHGVVTSPDSVAAFVTNMKEGTVSAIDTDTQKVVATYHVGAKPNGVTYRAD